MRRHWRRSPDRAPPEPWPDSRSASGSRCANPQAPEAPVPMKSRLPAPGRADPPPAHRELRAAPRRDGRPRPVRRSRYVPARAPAAKLRPAKATRCSDRAWPPDRFPARPVCRAPRPSVSGAWRPVPRSPRSGEFGHPGPSSVPQPEAEAKRLMSAARTHRPWTPPVRL